MYQVSDYYTSEESKKWRRTEIEYEPFSKSETTQRSPDKVQKREKKLDIRIQMFQDLRSQTQNLTLEMEEIQVE